MFRDMTPTIFVITLLLCHGILAQQSHRPVSFPGSNNRHVAPVSQSSNQRFNSLEQQQPPPIHPVTSFALELLKLIETKPANNLVISPISVQFLLSLLEQGSEGKLKNQLNRIIGPASSHQLTQVLQSKPNVGQLKSAAGIFHDNNIAINQTFKGLSEQVGAVLKNLDFKKSPDQSRDAINDWASRVTNGKIKNLLKESQNLQSAIMVLVSAIYFHSTWKYKFTPIDNQLFTTGGRNQHSIPFMEITQNIAKNTIDFNGVPATFIELPYEGGQYSMLIIVPENGHTLESLIPYIDISNFNQLIHNLRSEFPRFTTLQMPKFKLQTSRSLAGALKRMNLQDLFSPSGSLPYISDNSRPYVSDILQQATMTVDENGTVAAAATAALLIPLSVDGRQEPKLYKVDKPFLSIILDKTENAPIFIGKVNNPAF